MTIKSRITKLEKTTLATVEKNARAADAWLWAQFSDIELEGIILGDPDVMAKFENLNGHAITNKATSFFTQAEIAEMEELAAETCRRRLELCRGSYQGTSVLATAGNANTQSIFQGDHMKKARNTQEEFDKAIWKIQEAKTDLTKNLAKIEARKSFLANEQAGLAYPVERGDKQAQTRAKAINDELAQLDQDKETNLQSMASLDEQIAQLQAEARSIALQDAEHKRDHAALAYVQNMIDTLEAKIKIVKLEKDFRDLRSAARACDAQVISLGGMHRSYDRPILTDVATLRVLQEMRAELESSLK